MLQLPTTTPTESSTVIDFYFRKAPRRNDNKSILLQFYTVVLEPCIKKLLEFRRVDPSSRYDGPTLRPRRSYFRAPCRGHTRALA